MQIRALRSSVTYRGGLAHVFVLFYELFVNISGSKVKK